MERDGRPQTYVYAGVTNVDEFIYYFDLPGKPRISVLQNFRFEEPPTSSGEVEFVFIPHVNISKG
jgi:hypothetical protein